MMDRLPLHCKYLLICILLEHFAEEIVGFVSSHGPCFSFFLFHSFYLNIFDSWHLFSQVSFLFYFVTHLHCLRSLHFMSLCVFPDSFDCVPLPNEFHLTLVSLAINRPQAHLIPLPHQSLTMYTNSFGLCQLAVVAVQTIGLPVFCHSAVWTVSFIKLNIYTLIHLFLPFLGSASCLSVALFLAHG